MSSTLYLRQRLIDIARGEVGVVETPPNSNTGKRVLDYQRATDLAGTGWPWCAAFVCWCIREWLKDVDVLRALKMTAAQAEAWRPKTAAAFGFHDWAEKNGLLVMNDSMNNTLHTGDIMTFDMSHVGFVADDNGPYVSTIEGNTSSSGSRDGGGVFAKSRHRSEAKRFVRILQ